MRTTKPFIDPPVPTPREFAEWFHAPPLKEAPPEPTPWPRHRLIRLDVLLAAAFFLGALVARWPLIDRGETLLHSDEAIVGLMAQDIAEGRSLPIFFYGQRYMGALEAYVIAAISHVIPDPITALRLGPALFFAALVVVQYLMLTRWFGRRGGLVGAAVLLACGPMFAQWSISARGGYIEILLWGSALLWAYSEWFVPRDQGPRATFAWWLPFRRFDVSTFRRFAFGLLIGSGLWINPSIILFVAPITLHYLLNRPLGLVRGVIGANSMSRLINSPIALPACALVSIVGFNCLWYVYVDGAAVRSEILLGFLPRGISMSILGLAGLSAFVLAQKRYDVIGRAREMLNPAAPLVLGTLVGAAPALFYVVSAVVGQREMDPSLPLGLRPVWKIASTIDYLFHGLPLLFGADARPFLDLVTTGRPGVFKPLGILTDGILGGANWLILGAAATLALVFIAAYRTELAKLMRLCAGDFSPAILLLIGGVVTVTLYLLSGAAHDFNTIRYLVPLWAFVPGLIAAAVAVKRFRLQAHAACVCLVAAWGFGQFAMHRQLGNPHPLRPLADELVARRIDPAVAEIFDAHLLSYLTSQQCRVAEFDPFWSRLGHYQPSVEGNKPVAYLVPTAELTSTTNRWQHPGPPPPELSHPLPPRIGRAVNADPGLIRTYDRLPGGYELVVLNHPLRTQNTGR